MKIARGIGWASGALVVLLLSFAVGGYIHLRSTLTEYDGRIGAEDISAEIEIIRDSFGMPHIYAANDRDAAFALGYCTAQDRLFQMDMIRRTIHGRLAEVIGEDMVAVDRLFLTITAASPPDSMLAYLSGELIESLEAFTAGVNRYLAENNDLPFEFAILGHSPESWETSDCLAVLYYMAWALNFSFDTELANATIAGKVGSELAAEIFIDYPADGPSIIPGGEFTGAEQKLLQTMRLARQITGAPLRGASNNWVVSGKKSVTGKPLLANDMHLGLIIPGIWYEAHLITPELNVSGVVLPGAPLIVAGANQQVAWGLTNVMADDADFYLERINPEDSTQYEFKGQWEKMTFFHDTIPVAGGEPVPWAARFTRHGAIIDDIIDSQMVLDGPIAMRWTRHDFHNEAEAIYRLNRARSIDDIEEAAALFKCPGQNWVYADTAGNIGYWAAVGIPVRNGFDGYSLLPGWDGDFEWSGFVPSEKQPHMRNPERGWIATANNKVAGDDYPHVVAHAYAPPDRFERIRTLLTEKEKLSVNDFKRMQADEYLVMAEKWIPLISTALADQPLEGIAAKARTSLNNWDFEGRTDDAAPAVFHVLLQNVVEQVFKERLGDSLYEYYIGGSVFTIHNGLNNIITNKNSAWFDNPTTDQIEIRDTVLLRGFIDAVKFLTDRFGENINDWHWGELHSLTLFNPVGRHVPIIGNFMNAGPFPFGGGTNSVNAAIYRFARPWRVVAGASQRHIFDLGNMKNSLRIIPTGISGNFMSKHYDDQVELWQKVEYRPFFLDREDVERDIAYRMTIIPAAVAAGDERK
ncbi:MAG: penicillin acylase family protein [FCB group bacterium]|nr:penicillin acylase family protein [FCB group bacterium]